MQLSTIFQLYGDSQSYCWKARVNTENTTDLSLMKWYRVHILMDGKLTTKLIDANPNYYTRASSVASG
jgi:hypothetical protein